MTASRHLAGTSTSGAWPDRGRSGSDQVDGHFDVAAGCFGVRAGPVRFVDQVLCDAALETRKADVEAGAQKVAVVAQVQICRSEEHPSELQSLMRISCAVSRLANKIEKANNS